MRPEEVLQRRNEFQHGTNQVASSPAPVKEADHKSRPRAALTLKGQQRRARQEAAGTFRRLATG